MHNLSAKRVVHLICLLEYRVMKWQAGLYNAKAYSAAYELTNIPEISFPKAIWWSCYKFTNKAIWCEWSSNKAIPGLIFAESQIATFHERKAMHLVDLEEYVLEVKSH